MLHYCLPKSVQSIQCPCHLLSSTKTSSSTVQNNDLYTLTHSKRMQNENEVDIGLVSLSRASESSTAESSYLKSPSSPDLSSQDKRPNHHRRPSRTNSFPLDRKTSASHAPKGSLDGLSIMDSTKVVQLRRWVLGLCIGIYYSILCCCFRNDNLLEII